VTLPPKSSLLFLMLLGNDFFFGICFFFANLFGSVSSLVNVYVSSSIDEDTPLVVVN